MEDNFISRISSYELMKKVVYSWDSSDYKRSGKCIKSKTRRKLYTKGNRKYIKSKRIK